MENLNADGFHNENQNNGSSDDNSGFDPQFIKETSENHYDSHSEKKPHQSDQITNDEQDRTSYSNVDDQDVDDNDLDYEDDFDDNDFDENQDESDEMNRDDVDENGFPNHKDSLPTSI